MKKLISMTIACIMALAFFAIPVMAGDAEDVPVRKVGVLSMLTFSEEDMADVITARTIANQQIGDEGNAGSAMADYVPTYEVIYFDTLDAMLMALNVGDINTIQIYQSVAQYLCANNDDLMLLYSFDPDADRDLFETIMFDGLNSNDFAFLMLEDNTDLCEEFNAAIADMKADGTLDRLAREQITDLIEGGEIVPVTLPQYEDAEIVRIAVTGTLPPMDYVAPDGTPAGFNTAVLAEIGNRIGKNIELVVVDSVGRAAALASGNVDAVFWARTSSDSNKWAEYDEEEKAAIFSEAKAQMSEEEIAAIDQIHELVDFDQYGAMDMPEGTIATDPYFSDQIIPVRTKAAVEAQNADN